MCTYVKILLYVFKVIKHYIYAKKLKYKRIALPLYCCRSLQPDEVFELVELLVVVHNPTISSLNNRLRDEGRQVL